MNEKIEKRFEKSIQMNETDDHWIWTGYRDSNGHACIRSRDIGGKEIRIYAPRLSWLIYRPTEPTGDAVWRICGEVGCVQPRHLQTGSFSEQHFWNAEHNLRSNRGNPRCDPAAVLDDLENPLLTRQEISKRHGITPQEVCQIKMGKRFPEHTKPPKT